MYTPEAAQLFGTVGTKLSLEDYNYNHFRTKHYLLDAQGTMTSRGIQPGEMAPDFEMPQVGGGHLRLSELRGKPVLLHFGSYS